ncbi:MULTISPECIES: DUF5667 domain-containing protein [unclassified Nocardioides]|uniref:DUF5667 domain-containing protein n=1 Tax=unclassified Nocardioides TaxID=2615069 RepID=UPI0009F0C01C|nr:MULTISPECIES: DUF5667 domain-containing protein [unclassified Nocardioides]GAW48835.1 uncharacterized protein PD653B2_1150 [Nocardioides sp. PD653-B2]GAW54472.1 uncharacterized protein PD653_1880 [Nocardioides sp. PD653]
MTWGFTAQRRADQFDALVEGVSTADPRDARDADLLELVGAMRGVPAVTARPEFVATLRERLMAEADTALVPTDVSRLTLPARRPGRERRLAAVVGGIAIVGATTSIAVASQSALPGDSLYPIKRVLERAHTGLSVGEGNKGTTMLASATDRLDEVDALARQDDFGDDVRVADTLNAFTEQATAASDLLIADYTHTGNASSIAHLRDFASSSLDQLAALEPLVPADARDELIRAAGVLTTIDAEAAQRCPDCGGTPIESIPPVLASSELITVPRAPATTPRADDVKNSGGKTTGGQDSGGQGKGDDTDLPDVDGNDLGPGSVLDPGDTLPSAGSQTGGSNPLDDLAHTLTGGTNNNGPSGTPSAPSVGTVTQGVNELLHGVIDPVTGETKLPRTP